MSLYDTRLFMMTVAEAIDYFRIAPRLILICYSYMMYEVIQWFITLENPTTEQSALIVTVLGVAGAVIGLYQKSGKDWKNPLKPKDTDLDDL